MDKFDIKLERLTDGSIHAVVYGKRSFGAKKLGAFSGTVDEVMARAGRSVKAELNLSSKQEKVRQE